MGLWGTSMGVLSVLSMAVDLNSNNHDEKLSSVLSAFSLAILGGLRAFEWHIVAHAIPA